EEDGLGRVQRGGDAGGEVLGGEEEEGEEGGDVEGGEGEGVGTLGGGGGDEEGGEGREGEEGRELETAGEGGWVMGVKGEEEGRGGWEVIESEVWVGEKVEGWREVIGEEARVVRVGKGMEEWRGRGMREVMGEVEEDE
uniref:hypothetical protein n=1 Tax=Corynebacterium glyciniphilum TaxID=1404244 RepID=UPI0016433C8A